tara:strand:+ start:104 stop:475 length:372 start_codon:yes stop_codon:yes gene_type:complete
MDKALQAYGLSILAKDASSKWSNPKRALRNYEDIMEAARGDDTKDAFQQRILDLIKEAVGKKDDNALPEAASVKVNENTTLHTQPKPKPDPQYVTKKMFYDFRNELVAEFKKYAPPPVPPATP